MHPEQIFIKQESAESFGDDELIKPDESDVEDDWMDELKPKRPRIENTISTEVMNEEALKKDEDSYCDVCSKIFKNSFGLQIHLATDHDRNKGAVDCPICFKTYDCQLSFRMHFNTTHSIDYFSVGSKLNA